MSVLVSMVMAVRVVMIVIVAVRMRVPVMRMAVTIVRVVDRLDAWRNRHCGLRLRIELAADEQHQRRAEQRKQRYQPDVIEKVHVTTSAGRPGPPEPFPCCGTAR